MPSADLADRGETWAEDPIVALDPERGVRSLPVPSPRRRTEEAPRTLGIDMTVDFEIRRSPGFDTVSVQWTGPWSEARIRKEFEGLADWLKARKRKVGRWFFLEPRDGVWMVAIETGKGTRGSGRVRARSFPKSRVVRVTFDPEVVSPRVVYHGLTDFLRWRRKDKTIRSVGAYREVYRANPWTNPKANAQTIVEALVRP